MEDERPDRRDSLAFLEIASALVFFGVILAIGILLMRQLSI
jgi:hypothetical protein